MAISNVELHALETEIGKACSDSGEEMVMCEPITANIPEWRVNISQERSFMVAKRAPDGVCPHEMFEFYLPGIPNNLAIRNIDLSNGVAEIIAIIKIDEELVNACATVGLKPVVERIAGEAYDAFRARALCISDWKLEVEMDGIDRYSGRIERKSSIFRAPVVWSGANTSIRGLLEEAKKALLLMEYEVSVKFITERLKSYWLYDLNIDEAVPEVIASTLEAVKRVKQERLPR